MSNPDEVRHAVEDFLAFLRGSPAVPDADLSTLLDHLDRLSALGRHVSYQFESGHPDPPRPDWGLSLSAARKRFPGLGPYNIPDPIEGSPGRAKILVADPYDDVADLQADLEEVAWCFANTSSNDALWHFQLGYQSHWGEHLSNLRWYVMRHLAGTDAA
jgi:hypothetical protein